MRVFTPADILLPRVDDMTKWSCIACDQFTAEPEYWREAECIVGSEPSTLRLMLPEAWLGVRDSAAETRKIYAAMKDYVNRGIFRTVEDSFVYVERTLPSGAVRRGLVGKLDLECYDWAPGSATPVRATEGTVESRLPARVEVRRGATLEMPHIMVFIDDPENAVIPSAAGGEVLYDFELMLGGGHIRGSRVTGEAAERLTAALEAPEGSVRFAMGDGNHSLAAAKRCWEQIKRNLPESELETHPARYALAEIVNIHDEAVTFEPIHRVLLETVPRGFIEEAAARLPRGKGQAVTLLAGRREMEIETGMPLGALAALVDELLGDWRREHGGEPDYIHGDEEARALGGKPSSVGVLLPRLEKAELFPYITEHGPYPKKSFSIGHARDKRYYLECRAIVPEL
ncbi:MAG: DUF1015 domain-containing protein [Oscillospiraceae bacterium]|nr:DUF1015 domain-containing protein [Oscillospiraceae bacterium]